MIALADMASKEELVLIAMLLLEDDEGESEDGKENKIKSAKRLFLYILRDLAVHGKPDFEKFKFGQFEILVDSLS